MSAIKSMARSIIGALLLGLLWHSAGAADLGREARLKEQIIDYILDGEALMLKAGEHEFLSIYMESEAEAPKGGVILLHGRGFHPNWPQVIYPLRTGLVEHGWHTLSIQMPVLDKQATFYDYLDIVPESFPRISAAVGYLKQQGIEQIVLLAHSCSVHMAVAWLEQHPGEPISGFVGVGMGSTDKGQPMLRAFPLERFKFPILDIRGELDYPAVHGKAGQRWQAMQQAGHPRSRQQQVPGADHYFNDRDDALLDAVADWLGSLNP